jgi:hypothetical protein
MAQLVGKLERDEAPRPDMAPEGRRKLEYLRTALLLRQLHGRLAAAPTFAARSNEFTYANHEIESMK